MNLPNDDPTGIQMLSKKCRTHLKDGLTRHPTIQIS